jgi:predicted nucleic acid-binding protein
LVAATRSHSGASYQLLRQLAAPRNWTLNLSNAVTTEYVEVIHREGAKLGHSAAQLDTFLDYVCAAATEREIYFRWRPLLPDPDDDMLLELAVACGATRIVTFNKRHFAEAEQFGIYVVTPAELLAELKG